MNTNQQIEISRQIYTRLLGLYPQEHRSEYGTEMALLFADQCRAAVNQRGKPGLAALWLRTLVDLFKTVLIEHFSTPHARSGLLQGTPGKPLPWKGVLLVLIPGLVLFISQIGTIKRKRLVFHDPELGWICVPGACIADLVVDKEISNLGAGSNWAGFPQSFRSTGASFWLYRLSLLFILPFEIQSSQIRTQLIGDGFLGVPLFSLILVIILALLFTRRQKFSRAGWLWLGVYGPDRHFAASYRVDGMR